MNYFRKILILFLVTSSIILSGCASLEHKTVAAAGTVTALKLESAGSASTATPLPNILVGGAAMAFATSPDSERRPVYVSAKRTSTFAQWFGLGVSDEATIYIGAPGDTADSVRSILLHD